MRRFLMLFAVSALLQGCYSFAGPYVKEVTADGSNLNIEKCKLKMNVWTAHFQDSDCTTETVKVAK